MHNAKLLSRIFIFAFLLNLVWENLHAQLYVHYKNSTITEAVLLQASLVDALIISLVGLVLLNIRMFQKRLWISVIVGIIIAIAIEWFALSTGRWEYKNTMPIVPLLNTGLTPTIQLGLLGFLSIWISTRWGDAKRR